MGEAAGVDRSATGWSFSFSMDQHQVAKVHKRSDALSGNKDGVSARDGIGQDNEAPGQTHIPKRKWHLAFRFLFRRDPLNNPTRKKQALPEKSDAEPDAFHERQIGNIGTNTGKKFVHQY